MTSKAGSNGGKGKGKAFGGQSQQKKINVAVLVVAHSIYI